MKIMEREHLKLALDFQWKLMFISGRFCALLFNRQVMHDTNKEPNTGIHTQILTKVLTPLFSVTANINNINYSLKGVL